MTRTEATAIVQSHITLTDAGYKMVSHEAARSLVSAETWERFTKDRIRFLGPIPGTLYWWNVVDYVQFPDMGADPYELARQRIAQQKQGRDGG
jgi:hypothetical protein